MIRIRHTKPPREVVFQGNLALRIDKADLRH